LKFTLETNVEGATTVQETFLEVYAEERDVIDGIFVEAIRSGLNAFARRLEDDADPEENALQNFTDARSLLFILEDKVTILYIQEFEDEEGEKDGRLEVSYLVTVEENEAANISLLMEDEDAVHIVEGTLRELLENAPLETSDVVFILGEMTVEVIPPPIPPEDNDTTLLVVGIVASVFLFSFCVCGIAMARFIVRKRDA